MQVYPQDKSTMVVNESLSGATSDVHSARYI